MLYHGEHFVFKTIEQSKGKTGATGAVQVFCVSFDLEIGRSDDGFTVRGLIDGKF